jgi:hypothetical protein
VDISTGEEKARDLATFHFSALLPVAAVLFLSSPINQKEGVVSSILGFSWIFQCYLFLFPLWRSNCSDRNSRLPIVSSSRPKTCNFIMSRSSMDVTYFRQLQNLNRKIALQYKLAVPREEISARLAPHDAAVENRKEKHNVLSGYEKNKEATDEIQAAKAAYEIALEHERNERAKVLKYLESILDHIHLENQDNEIIQALMKCAILKDATPKGLADFCQESDYNAKIVQELLDSSPEIMKKMLVNGGAAGGNYGRSYSIYKHLLTMIDPDDKLYGPCHERLAMAVALEHGKPIEGFDTPDVFVNPFSRFEHYVKAHKAGELDPAFSYFSTWEYRHVVNCDATEGQLQWARDHLKRYRPDQIFMPDVAWRYAEAVRTDVGYRKANWTSQPKTYQQLVSGGGKCGPRAW